MLVSVSLLVACTDGMQEFKGTKMSDYFPQDGERVAEYTNDDTTTYDWKLRIEKDDQTERVDEEEVVTWEWSREDTGDLLGSVKWSSTSNEGIKIHGYSVGTEEFTTFDTPVLVTDDDDYMNKNESVVTETNGYTFTSTLLGVESCPVLWGPDDWECVHIVLDDGDGDDTAGPIFAGEYWLVPRYGPAWMILTGYEEKWDLSFYEQEAYE